MKRYGNLGSQITEFPNLLAAAKQAQKGKRFRENVLQFNDNLEKELFKIQSEIQSKTYIPGGYYTFEILEPKPRIISAAPYRDRVVHHALCNIIAPVFDRSFSSASYANRVGFGSHRALKKFVHFTRDSRYVLLCDIRKYFPNIDHEILKSLIRRKIKCPDTLWLIDTIIDASNPQDSPLEYFPTDDLFTPLQRRRGLPIGNLTSQLFANIYLNSFDHFIKQTLQVRKYIRYMDDFALCSDDHAFLSHARSELEQYLTTLRLKIHAIKSQCSSTEQGATFLGFRVLNTQSDPPKTRIRVKPASLRRARTRLKRLQHQYAHHQVSLRQISQSLQSWEAHLKHGNTWKLRQKIFSRLVFHQTHCTSH
jgi:retron-type reverse transcriptase